MKSIFDTDLDKIEAIEGVTRKQFDEDIRPAGRPVILKNIAKNWPAVKARNNSIDALAEYLKSLDVGASASTYIGPAEILGRYFYKPDMSGFTFDKRDIPLRATIDKLLELQSHEAPVGIYAGASPTQNTLPQFGSFNAMPLVDASVAPKVWIGNSAQIAPHFDTSENIACLVSGERKFVLFPPDQIENLYVGPIDYNMAGQPASMVDLNAIDLERFPNFEDAMQTATLGQLSPGDAIYIPCLWWHFVESKGPFNVLANYWWNDAQTSSPMNVLALALLVLRDLPPNERTAWASVFDHYVFSEQAANAVDHIPEEYRGVLGTKSPQRDARIKTFLRSQLPGVLG